MAEGALKPGWTWVKFGDVVRQVKNKVDAKKSGLKRYVAGQHMVTDDLRIRRWGEINDDYLGPAFHVHFKPGQVLYGSRRTYLRKVAVADFEGICANTTFVLESKKPSLLLPELLPFIMQTEAFHEYSIKQSRGSVNPYINFSDLARYEFALPPLEEQRRVARLLKSIELQCETIIEGKNKLRQLKHSLEKKIFISDHLESKIAFGKLLQQGKVTLQTGPFGTVLKASSYTKRGHPVVNPSDIVDNRITLEKCRFIDDSDWIRLHKYQLKINDMLIGRKGSMQNIVFVKPEYDGYLLGSDCIRFRVHDSSVEPRFLYYFLRADVTRQWLQTQAYGTVMPGINEKLLARMTIPVPNHDMQILTINKLNEVDKSEILLDRRKSENRNIKLAILKLLE